MLSLMQEITIFVKKLFMVKAIIIEDDPNAQELIVKTIESYIPNVGVLATANDLKSGIGSINEHEPDLVILDS